MKCPFCAEEIQPDAKKCKHCGEWLQPPPVASPSASSAQQPSAAPQKTSPATWLGCLGVLVLLYFLISYLGRPVDTSFITSPPRRPTSGPIAPTAAPVPSAPVAWHKVEEWRGEATKKTKTFRIEGDEWRVSWVTRAGNMGNGSFSISVYDAATNQMTDLAANVIGENSDNTILRGAGEYYLDISALQPYAIRVEDHY